MSREKLLNFFIALRRELEDEDFLTPSQEALGRAQDGKDREGNNPPGKAYLKEHQSPPANIYLHEADLWIERKMQEREMEYEIGFV